MLAIKALFDKRDKADHSGVLECTNADVLNMLACANIYQQGKVVLPLSSSDIYRDICLRLLLRPKALANYRLLPLVNYCFASNAVKQPSSPGSLHTPVVMLWEIALAAQHRSPALCLAMMQEWKLAWLRKDVPGGWEGILDWAEFCIQQTEVLSRRMVSITDKSRAQELIKLMEPTFSEFLEGSDVPKIKNPFA